MIALRRPGRLPTHLLLAAVLVSACGAASPSPSPTTVSTPPGSPTSSSTSPRATAASAPVEPRLTPVPRAESATPALTLPPTTQTPFGLVWDGLPPSWPQLPGQSESEVGTDASANLVVHGDPLELAHVLGDVLVARGWSVDIGSVLEDGSVVVDATGAPKTCKAEARFVPNSPGSLDGDVLIYYGAACPFA